PELITRRGQEQTRPGDSLRSERAQVRVSAERREQVLAGATVFHFPAEKEAELGVPITDVVRRVGFDRGLPAVQGYVHPTSPDQSGSHRAIVTKGLGVEREESLQMDIGFGVPAQLQKEDDKVHTNVGYVRRKIQSVLVLFDGLLVPAERLQRPSERVVAEDRSRTTCKGRLMVAHGFPVVILACQHVAQSEIDPEVAGVCRLNPLQTWDRILTPGGHSSLARE